ncbi:Crp/Fnr family transcriptional regulator [Schleiferilactobacillus harbinensis]|jgi:CRP/FNR family transcriptional regulator|uniref:Crp/Fnr family transcriptional regulator n=1 Tax=Schleiferilactobacillus harbinensis TaxID=304207 RepID=UPI0007BACDF9|nr:Crp/Fnr family transcriptional regulator [Schleiferilactobacillus harbinensis]MBO3092738.1 Crp/Fnr family transcriptional regulator [Schleiferilactobacillus harbinensis]MCI1850253.1 Crp/Fnr family transcriptional regulator [Schleiferilactobacillus harbinensis]MCT2908781.1 Crp/Fnr family transcriptional regulator [Schleiferilactobacillus harbinensis]
MATVLHHCTRLVPLFAELSQPAKDEIDALTQDRQLQKGEQIARPGDGERLVVVAHGLLKTYQLSASGKEQLLSITKPGGYVGEQALLGAPNPNAYTEALQASTVCFIDRSDFTRLLLDHPRLSVALLTATAKKIQRAEQQTGYLADESVPDRIQAYLQDLRTEAGTDTVTIPFAWKELANYLGTTPETMSRQLKIMTTAGMISRQGKTITFLCQ